MNRLVGLVLIGFSSLTAAIVLALAGLVQNVDEIDGTYSNDYFSQLPVWVYILILIPFVIGLILCDKKDSEK